MKRTDGLYDISRRSFVTLAGVGGVSLVIACNSSMDTTVDAPLATDDAATSGACSTSAVDVGASATFSLNKPVIVVGKGLVIVRDGDGLYAMSSACTHQGQTLCVGSLTACSSAGTDLHCTRHGAAFSFAGAVIRGPAARPLPHYAMCVLANGNLGVEKSLMVPATTRFAR